MTNVAAVFDCRTPDELAAYYDRWASTYEADLGDHAGPAEIVDAVCRLTRPEARILDAGCGTGIAGRMLLERGYANVDGLDLSAGMLAEAAAKGCYRNLHHLALGPEIALPDDSYDAAFSVGVFVRSHAPASSLAGLARLVKPGGYVIFALRPEFCEASDFQPTIDRMLDGGIWRHLETGPRFDARYREFPEVQLQIRVFEVLR